MIKHFSIFFDKKRKVLELKNNFMNKIICEKTIKNTFIEEIQIII